jgi:hypothetical protein
VQLLGNQHPRQQQHRWLLAILFMLTSTCVLQLRMLHALCAWKYPS